MEQIGAVVLRSTEESDQLAGQYVTRGVLTTQHLNDALHVAIATVSQMDALVSWNYRHLVNVRRRQQFDAVNALMGYPPLLIVTPPEVTYGE